MSYITLSEGVATIEVTEPFSSIDQPTTIPVENISGVVYYDVLDIVIFLVTFQDTIAYYMSGYTPSVENGTCYADVPPILGITSVGETMIDNSTTLSTVLSSLMPPLMAAVSVDSTTVEVSNTSTLPPKVKQELTKIVKSLTGKKVVLK